jgi:hypothetical protein
LAAAADNFSLSISQRHTSSCLVFSRGIPCPVFTPARARNEIITDTRAAEKKIHTPRAAALNNNNKNMERDNKYYALSLFLSFAPGGARLPVKLRRR